MIFQRDKKIGVFYFFFSLSTVLTFLQFRQSFQNEPFSLEMNPQHPDCYLLILFVKELILQYKLIHDSTLIKLCNFLQGPIASNYL